MYRAMVGSPITTIATTISDSATTIDVVNGLALPDAPNLATLGSGETAEVILYTGKTGNTLTGVTRGFQGTARAWQAGTTIGRFLTAYDLNSIQENHETHLAEMANKVISQNLVTQRDVTLAGLQTITYPNLGKPKKIKITSWIHGGSTFSIGTYDNDIQRVMLQYTSGATFSGGSYMVFVGDGSSHNFKGKVSNITETGFDIDWTLAGTLTGTMHMIIELFY